MSSELWPSVGSLSQSGGGGSSGGASEASRSGQESCASLAASEVGAGGASVLETGVLATEQPSAGGGSWLFSWQVVQGGGFSGAVGSCCAFVSCFSLQGSRDKTDERLVAWSESIRISGVSPSANGERPAQLESTGTGLLQHFHRRMIATAMIIPTKMMPIISAAIQLPSLGSASASGSWVAVVTARAS